MLLSVDKISLKRFLLIALFIKFGSFYHFSKGLSTMEALTTNA